MYQITDCVDMSQLNHHMVERCCSSNAYYRKQWEMYDLNGSAACSANANQVRIVSMPGYAVHVYVYLCISCMYMVRVYDHIYCWQH